MVTHLFLAAGSLLVTMHHHAIVVSKKGPTLLLSSHTREGFHSKGEMRGRNEEADDSKSLTYDPLTSTLIYREPLYKNPNGSLMGIGSSSNNH